MGVPLVSIAITKRTTTVKESSPNTFAAVNRCRSRIALSAYYLQSPCLGLKPITRVCSSTKTQHESAGAKWLN